MKKLLIRIGMAAGLFAALAILGLGVLAAYISAVEYRPAETETLDISGPANSRPGAGPLTVLSWNIGYAALDAGQDFFMDGGKGVRPRTGDSVRENLAGIRDFIASRRDDIVLIQEADIRSRRSYYIDQAAALAAVFPGSSAFAHNFLCRFVPFPLPECIGEVSSGLLTLNTFQVDEAARISLPNPFSWPVRTVNLKRCLLAERIPLDPDENGESRELVLVNLHLEAYDSGGGREAQTRALMEFLYREYEKGNYCIAGGDFNQTFPGLDETRFPIKSRDYFAPGVLSPSLLRPAWRFAADLETPSARLLDKPYSGGQEDAQLYIIDGFILSPNVELLSVKTIDLNFRHSDHNPVEIKVLLNP